MNMKTAYLRVKFRVRMHFADNEATMRRLERMKQERLQKPFCDKLVAMRKSLQKEVLLEGRA